MIDFSLTEEQQALQRTARDFATNEIKPLVQTIANADLSQTTPWELGKDMFRKGTELGFTSIMIPEEMGGIGGNLIDACILMEELAVGDVSIAADYFNLSATLPLMWVRGADEQQLAEWMPQFTSGEPHLLAGAQSEPNVAGSELFSPSPEHGMKTFAKREGDEYVITGNKSAFITNAGAAKTYVIMARTEMNKPLMESVSIFIVPHDTPGLTVGNKTELIGWHNTHHAELFLDNVRVPVSHRLGAEGGAMQLFMQIPEMAICLAACFVGHARRAYEYALDYAKQRVSWGKPIIEHQAVALKLADMYTDLQTARLLTWDAAATAASNPMVGAAVKGPAAKSHAVDVAIKNAERAVQILGAYGVTKEYEAGSLLNDAWVGYSCDFTRDMLRLGMVPFLDMAGS